MSAGPATGDPAARRGVLTRRGFGIGAVSAGLAGLLGGATAAGVGRPRPSARPHSAPALLTTAGTIHGSRGDRTAAIRAWLAEPSPDGVKRMIGSFRISATLYPSERTHLDLGAATITLAPEANTTMIALAKPGIRVTGGRLMGSGGRQSGGGNAIAVTADGCAVLGTRIDEVHRSGIVATGVDRLTVDRVTVTDSGDNGIYVETAGAARSDISITGCVVDRARLRAGDVREGGIKVHGGRNATIARVRVHGCAVRLPERPADYACVGVEVWYAPAASVRGVTTTGGFTGVSVATSPEAVVSGNRVVRAAEYGVELASTPRASANRNAVQGSSITQIGIALTSSTEGTFSEGAAVVDNDVSGCLRNGIVSLGAGNLKVAGNLVTGAAGYLVTLIAATGGVVSGNDLDGAGTAQKCVMLDTCSNVSVSGNDLRGVTETGVYLYSAKRGYVVRSITVQSNLLDLVNVGLDARVSNGARLGTGIRVHGNPGVPDSNDWAQTRVSG